VFGSIADSVLGATVQAKYAVTGGYTEYPPSKKTKPDKGFRIINNNMVNIMSVTLAGALCLLL
jgi:uncharacterized membrane protein